MRSIRLLVCLFALAGLLGGAGFQGRALAANHVLTQEQADEVRQIVRDYLLRNPEVILEAIEALRAREQSGAEERTRQVVDARRSELLNDPGSPIGGNPKGDVSIVEFYDYRCPYCKRVHQTIQALIQQDKGIRFVYKEWPILGPASNYAARAALASRGQGKYKEFHAALMEVRGALDEAAVLNAAKAVGLDVERLKRDTEKQSAEFDAIFARNDNLARSLDISGTPAFVIGDVVIRGAIELEGMKTVIADIRKRARR